MCDNLVTEKVELNNVVSVCINKIGKKSFLIENRVSPPGFGYKIRKLTRWGLMAPQADLYSVLLYAILASLSASLIFDFFTRVIFSLIIFIFLLLLISYYDLFVQASFLKSVILEKKRNLKWSETYLAFLGSLILDSDSYSVYSIGKKFKISKSSADEMIKKLIKQDLVKVSGDVPNKKYEFVGLKFNIISEKININSKKSLEEYLSFLFRVLCIIAYYSNGSSLGRSTGQHGSVKRLYSSSTVDDSRVNSQE